MLEIIDFGLAHYGEILEMQTKLFENLISQKKTGKIEKEYLLLGEHPAVITLGRRAKPENILATPTQLHSREIPIFQIGRGGDVTYHCPGQLIVYPIIDLERHNLGVKEYVNTLEESVIRLLRKYGIEAERIESATGVWLGKNSSEERKVCAIGVKCSRFCTMHGLALNVNADLSGFSLINPCGFQDKGVTSIHKEMRALKNEKNVPCGSSALEGFQSFSSGEKINMGEVKKDFLRIFLSLIFPFEEILNFPE